MERKNKVPQLRFTGFNSEGELKRLGDITELITKGTTPSHFSGSGVRFVKIESFNGDFIDVENCLFINENIQNSGRKVLCRKCLCKIIPEIFNLLNTETQLRSKKELIEKFIMENMPIISDTDDIPQEFEKFWTVEQEKAFIKMVEEEKLSKEKTQALIENYLYSEQQPMRDEILALLEGEKPKLLQRKSIGERILGKIVSFVETFINGIAA